MTFGDQKTGVIGLDKSIVRTNRADFIVKAGGTRAKSPTPRFKVTGTHDREEIIQFDVSDQGDDEALARAQIAYSGATGFLSFRRLTDGGATESAAWMTMDRATGTVACGQIGRASCRERASRLV